MYALSSNNKKMFAFRFISIQRAFKVGKVYMFHPVRSGLDLWSRESPYLIKCYCNNRLANIVNTFFFTTIYFPWTRVPLLLELVSVLSVVVAKIQLFYISRWGVKCFNKRCAVITVTTVSRLASSRGSETRACTGWIVLVKIIFGKY